MKLALLSKNVITEKARIPEHAVILIDQGIIKQVLSYKDANLDRIKREYRLEDLGSLYISPGLVDLNVSFNEESASTVTKAAASGGTTTIASHQIPSGDLYCDFAQLGEVHDSNLDTIPEYFSTVFGLKAYLTPQGLNRPYLTKIEQTLKILDGRNLPLLIHPEYAEESLIHLASPFRLQQVDSKVIPESIKEFDEGSEESNGSENSHDSIDSSSEYDSEHEDIVKTDSEDLSISAFNSTPSSDKSTELRRTSMIVQTFIRPFSLDSDGDSQNMNEKADRRVSLPNLFSSVENCESVIDNGYVLFKTRGEKYPLATKKNGTYGKRFSLKRQIRPQSLEELVRIQEGKRSSIYEYIDHLSFYPSSWETSAITKIQHSLKDSKCKVHFCNLSSACGISKFLEIRELLNATCETSVPYLYFNVEDIRAGDTRYKTNPPIRDCVNANLLWDYLKLHAIDSISSYHQPIHPSQKLLGDFRKARNGVCTIGFSLQAVWTRIKKPIMGEQLLKQYLVKISHWLSSKPAEILNLDSRKGSIAVGKDADFVIWDPFTTDVVSNSDIKYPEMTPFIGEELCGKIHRTYLRGECVYDSRVSRALGTSLIPK